MGAKPMVLLRAESEMASEAVNPLRLASVAAIVIGVTAGIIILLDLAFASRVIEVNAELVATLAILGGSSTLYAWLDARRRIVHLRSAERELAKARDEAEEANRTKSMFLATMSHEIRTPMNGVLGMLRLLTETDLSKEQDSYAKAARQSGEVLLALIDEILDFSKIEAGRLDLRLAPFEILRLVEDVVELLAPRAHAKGISVACYVDPELRSSYIGDAARLRQILLNLAGNAVKFTESGGVSIIAEPCDDTAGGIRFRVKDTGIGMNPEELGAIFEEFIQVDSSPSRRFGGTGLGLAITRRLVERMDGEISVDSAPGKGSQFQVSLSLASETAGTPPRPAAILNGLTVSLVGADPVTASASCLYLRDFGGTVTTAPDCAGILDSLSRAAGVPDVVVVDAAIGIERALALPGEISGACEFDVPPRLAILLAPEDRKDLRDLKDAGYGGYLIKPLRRSSLIEQIAALGAPDTGNNQDLMVSTDLDGENDIPHVKPLNVLLAEDNEVNAMLSRSILERAGHSVCLAVNGREAVEFYFSALNTEPFDVVLMDVHMPDVDGLEATRQIRIREQSGKKVPIAALTANAFQEDRDECLDAGMDDYLSKPFEPESLARTLYRLCGQKDDQVR